MARHSRHISDPRDKVDYPDPAASPLGTDAEAAAAPPGPRETAQALNSEIRPLDASAWPSSESRWAFAFFLAFFIACFGAMGLVFAVL